jgi:NAD(P)-dependent dehydrogenase (short-subunit alcohol dehydrogenase family)
VAALRTVIVTGANRGLGLGLVTRLAQRPNYEVIATARHPQQADELHALAAATGRVRIEELDVTSEESIGDFVVRLADVDCLEVLIHNAAIVGYQELAELSIAAFSAVFEANVFGPAVLTRHLRSKLRRGSLIVLLSSFTGSISGTDGRVGFPYRMSKAALNMFARQLSIQLRDEGIGVLLLRPGQVRTRMGGPDAPLDIETSVNGMLAQMDNFSMAIHGEFVGYDGKIVPW